MRDLFTEDAGGWLEDMALLDRLAGEKLAAVAEEVRAREGWKWTDAHLDYPHSHGFSRVYPHAVSRTDEEHAEIARLSGEYDTLLSENDASDELPQAVDARLKAIDAALQAFGEDFAYDPAEVARAGAYVVLGHDGHVRIERGVVRPGDRLQPPEPDVGDVSTASGGGDTPPSAGGDEEAGGAVALPERLILDLTAHRTMALRDALAEAPALALIAVIHALAIRTFFPGYDQPTCLEVKTTHAFLDSYAPGIGEVVAGRKVGERHAAWAARLPREPGAVWAAVVAMSEGDRLALLAHCAAQAVNAVHSALDRKPGVWAHADVLAEALALDMVGYWRPTEDSYLGRVTKAQIGEAVRDGVSPEAAERIADLKRGDMAKAAEILLAGTEWLPPLLRTTSSEAKAEHEEGVSGGRPPVDGGGVESSVAA